MKTTAGTRIQPAGISGRADAATTARRSPQKAGSILERAIASGEFQTDTPVDLLVELLAGPIYYRWLVMHEPTDAVRIRAIVRRALW